MPTDAPILLKQDDPFEPADWYEAAEAKRALPRALIGGTESMLAEPEYLPQEPAEEDDDYEIRRNRSVLFNAFRRAVCVLVGKPLARKIVRAGIPPAVEPLLDDVDGRGTPLELFCRDWFFRAWVDGECSVLVDFPGELALPRDANLKQEREANLRPYLVLVPAADLIGLRKAREGGGRVLDQIRIRCTTTVPLGAYGEETVEQVRVFNRDGSYAAFEKNDEGLPVLVQSGRFDLSRIPLVTLRLGDTPPLLDLAYLNLTHFRSSSDQRHILHVARVPLLFGPGFSDEDLVVSPNAFISNTNSDSDLKYVEIQGGAIAAGASDLASLQEQMAMLSMEMLIPRSTGNVTATARALEFAESSSDAQAAALQLQEAINDVLELLCEWLGVDVGLANLSVVTDFGITLGDMQELQVLASLRNKPNPDLSRRQMLEELKQRGALRESFDFDENDRELEEESAASAAAQADMLAGALAASVANAGRDGDGNADDQLATDPNAVDVSTQ